jgi:sugar phosphate permease
MLMFVIMMFRNFVPTYLTDVYKFTNFEIGALGSFLFASSAVLGILLGRLGDIKPKSYSLAISLLLSTVAIVLMLGSSSFGILAISFVLNGGSYMAWSMLSAVVAPTAPESCRAKWIAVPQTACMFTSSISRVWGKRTPGLAPGGEFPH